MASSQFSYSAYFWGPNGSTYSGLAGENCASSSLRCTAAFSASLLRSVVLDPPALPSRTELIVTDRSNVKAEVVTPLFANRTYATSRSSILAVQSGKDENFKTLAVSSCACSLVSMLVGSDHLYLPESRRRASMTDRVKLNRLPFHPRPTRTSANSSALPSVARFPEIWRPRLVSNLRHHSSFLSAFDFPERVAAELEVIALLIDRIASAAFNQDSVINAGDEVIERDIGLPRPLRNIRHALKRHTRPRVGITTA